MILFTESIIVLHWKRVFLGPTSSSNSAENTELQSTNRTLTPNHPSKHVLQSTSLIGKTKVWQ